MRRPGPTRIGGAGITKSCACDSHTELGGNPALAVEYTMSESSNPPFMLRSRSAQGPASRRGGCDERATLGEPCFRTPMRPAAAADHPMLVVAEIADKGMGDLGALRGRSGRLANKSEGRESRRHGHQP